MRVDATNIRLVFGSWARLSSTRATGNRDGAMSRPKHCERRSSTRATCGPPFAGQPIRNEGPAQPALRRFRVRSKTRRHPSLGPPPNWGAKVAPMGRLAAFQRFGRQQKGVSMSSA